MDLISWTIVLLYGAVCFFVGFLMKYGSISADQRVKTLNKKIEDLEEKSAQAYQVIGGLLTDTSTPRFGSEEGDRLLDYFAETYRFDPDFRS